MAPIRRERPRDPAPDNDPQQKWTPVSLPRRHKRKWWPFLASLGVAVLAFVEAIALLLLPSDPDPGASAAAAGTGAVSTEFSTTTEPPTTTN
jgi:hypothetical protein